jgi:hypothetical protein
MMIADPAPAAKLLPSLTAWIFWNSGPVGLWWAVCLHEPEISVRGPEQESPDHRADSATPRFLTNGYCTIATAVLNNWSSIMSIFGGH